MSFCQECQSFKDWHSCFGNIFLDEQAKGAGSPGNQASSSIKV
jgi:hypothetical protein